MEETKPMQADSTNAVRWWQFGDWPLAAKLVAGLLLVSLAPLLLASYYNTHASIEALRNTELKNLKQVAGNVAGRVGQLLTDTRRLVAYVSSEGTLIALLQQPGPATLVPALAQMQHLLSANPDIDLAIVMDKNGEALLGTEPSVVGRNFRFREYFVSAIQGRPYTSSIIVGAAAGASGVYVSQPIKDRSGLVQGIVMLRLTDVAIRTIVEDERYSKLRIGFIVDSDGVVIYHPQRDWMHHSLVPLPEIVQTRIAQDRRFARTTIESLDLAELADAAIGVKDAGAIAYPGRDLLPQIAGFAPVRVHPWTVVFSSPEEEFAAPLRQLFWRMIVVVASLAVLFGLRALLFARYLTRPLGRLTRSALALARGEFAAARTGINRRDEIGVLARTFDQMGVALQERENEREIFGRMVSPDVRDKLLKGELKLGGEQIRVAVLFSDIRGFTAISEATGPHDVVFMLNEYLTEMTEAIKPWDGYVNNFIGDAIVVVFGAPAGQKDIEWRAINAAFGIRKRLAQLNTRRVERGDPPIDNGVGIASGRVIAGQMGSLERCVYTVIGDTVNVAARIEGLTRNFLDHPILVNDDIYNAVKDRPGIRTIPLGEQQLKGRQAAVSIYAVEPDE